ncbi:3-phosphoinositide-dependent protein kinase-1 [Dorcoceras hygrometricum]|uniref:3-phosphoinositide-dependent protein kinase-1 n=1 Tax=Dorcoceras hygrometricum TaxID=472368 RepID=A0A2Z7A977_9LAMI|nr:3-phosphoinositide-dependent protein kinase-1 [Dorcoceras hygrometricum]
MADIVAETPTWEEIERAESFLVCCMFDEAASLSSSILRRCLENYHLGTSSRDVLERDENEWCDMLESAGMVLVQSLKQLQRTSEILDELKLLFGSLAAIPIQIFLTGVCFLMSENPSGTVQASLEEFLNNWRYVDDRYYPLLGEEFCASHTEGSCVRFSVSVDQYLNVVELYVITLLAMTLKETDLAISWVEKAMLPLEKRQELLRRLNSLNFSMVTSSSRASASAHVADEYNTKYDTLRDQQPYNGQLKGFETINLSNRGSTTKEEILKLSREKAPCFWWFPTINLKFRNNRVAVPSWKIVLAALLLLLYYFTRKKHTALKRVLTEKALSMKNALLDLWQLAFSYQVNPLAAVQSLPTSSR